MIVVSGCIPLSTYCQLFGESPDAVDKRIQRGLWRQGKEYLKIAGVRERWVDLDAISEWARQNSEG